MHCEKYPQDGKCGNISGGDRLGNKGQSNFLRFTNVEITNRGVSGPYFANSGQPIYKMSSFKQRFQVTTDQGQSSFFSSDINRAWSRHRVQDSRVVIGSIVQPSSAG